MTEPPFPSLRSAERAALAGFVIGTLAMTATFGARTGFFLPDYFADWEQTVLLAGQAAAELLVAFAVGSVALSMRRGTFARLFLAVAAVALMFVKSVAFVILADRGEPNPWVVSPGTMALCALVQVPLWISFFGVLKLLSKARGPRGPQQRPGVFQDDIGPGPAPLDAPLNVRAALVVWLATVGIGVLVLGPDGVVRLAGGAVLALALVNLRIGAAEEVRLVEWARQAITQGPPAIVLREDPAPAGVPSLFGDDANKAVLYAISEDPGSYRREAARTPLAAVDPVRGAAPRLFGQRVGARLLIALVATAVAVAISWPLLHSKEIPPRVVSATFTHFGKIEPEKACSIEGLSLWSVHEADDDHILVGYDPVTREVVRGEALFRHATAPSLTEMARLANRMMLDGRFPVIDEYDLPAYTQETGERPKAPFVKDGKLFFWRNAGGVPLRSEVPYPLPPITPLH